MRRKISLYIADKLVDLDEQSFILFNHTMEDLSNPTIVRNSFSQQVTIKGTSNNNKIFGDLFRLDRVTQYGASSTGAYFSALRKTPFTIYNELNEVVERGYIKLDGVSKNRGMVEYKVTLYGGLGLFFYNLMYKDDGTKKTLADVRYKTSDGTFTSIAGHFGQAGGYSMMLDAWSYLAHPEEYDPSEYDNWWANIINFAPAYNGLPDKFSADKALVVKKSFGNMPVVMSPKTGASSNLMLFTNPHTEWEVKDLRWYLQRPIISIKAIFDAACDHQNNGGWDVNIDSGLQDSEIFQKAWMTLPLIPADDRNKEDAIVRLLSSMKSPAEYIISFAKILGLVFLCDSATKTITIMPRKKFYQGEVVDLSHRIARDSIQMVHILSESRFYQYGAGAIGEWARQYKEDFGLDYGIHRVNTGNEFNNDTTIVTDGIIYKDAVEVQERNLLFVSEFDRPEQANVGIEIFRLPRYENVTLQQWKTDADGAEIVENESITSEQEFSVFFDNPDYPLSDWLPKVQFHDGNKAADGSEVLLLFNGVKDTPQWKSWARLQYRVSDDTPDMTLLNDGVPCWNFTETNSRVVSKLPSFRRCLTHDVDGDDVIDDTFEWGEPNARGVNGTFYDLDKATIYNRYWKTYQQDRFDDDTFRMTCKVDLRGMQVGQQLMRKFFFYQGAVFALNRIINHSLTTWDDTECEFVKVQDKLNYLN